MDLSTNINTRWMAIFVDELARNGLDAVCIAPGSRSTPLALAFAAQPAIRIYRHLDERSAGFFALGMAKATRKPVALVCTSGTAAANFHPAIIEAYYSHVPLIILTADRPAELRGSGANQTIDQIKMYGDHVRWSVEVPTPDIGSPDVTLRHLRTLAARACATAGGLTMGPVHLNFPFRKPLEPDPSASENNEQDTNAAVVTSRAHTLISRGRLLPDEQQVSEIANLIAEYPHGLIICGPECPGDDFPAAVTALAERSGYPILADPLSNLRHGSHTANGFVLGGQHLWLPSISRAMARPDIILRFGSVPTSAVLAGYIGRVAPVAHIHIRENGEWADDLHLTSRLIQADPSTLCSLVEGRLSDHGYQADGCWAASFKEIEGQTWECVTKALQAAPFFDGSAIRQTLASLPERSIVFVGNSMPIRHVDTFDQPSTRSITFFGNRGASGIDGNVSTALGVAAATGQPVTAILGDITFYHDMNGLLAVGQHDLQNITFVVVNNDGGGIFHRLPVAAHEPPFTDLFLTPHGLTFEHAAAMYGLRYATVADAAELEAELKVDAGTARIIEIRTNSAADYSQMRAISTAVTTGLETIFTQS